MAYGSTYWAAHVFSEKIGSSSVLQSHHVQVRDLMWAQSDSLPS